MVDVALSRDGAAPKYTQLENIIRDKIVRAEWTPGMKAPSERELCDTYGLARMTVRQAQNNLVVEGFLVRVHGKGTFVARPRLRQSLGQLTGFSEDMRDRGVVATAQLLAREQRDATEAIAAALALPIGAPTLFVQRLRLANGHPIAVESCTLRGDVGALLAHDDLEGQSLYRLLEQRCGVQLTRAGQDIEAGVANEAEARLLGMARGAAVLHIQRTSFAPWQGHEAPIEYVHSTYRGDRYRFHVELAR